MKLTKKKRSEIKEQLETTLVTLQSLVEQTTATAERITYFESGKIVESKYARYQILEVLPELAIKAIRLGDLGAQGTPVIIPWDFRKNYWDIDLYSQEDAGTMLSLNLANAYTKEALSGVKKAIDIIKDMR